MVRRISKRAQSVRGEELPLQLGREVVVGAGLAAVGADGCPPGVEVRLDVDDDRDVLVGRTELPHRKVRLATAGRPHVVGPSLHRRARQAPRCACGSTSTTSGWSETGPAGRSTR